MEKYSTKNKYKSDFRFMNMFHINKSRWLISVLEMALDRLCHNSTSHFSQFTITQLDSQCDNTLYQKNSILQTIHLVSILRFFFCFFFCSFFLFPFSFSYKIVQNYSALIEDFANPNKKSVYLAVLFMHRKQFGTLGFCVDGKAFHFLPFTESLKR